MILLLISCGPKGSPESTAQPERLTPPVAERRAHTETMHGVTLSDDYHWMRQRDDPALMPYLEAENAYTAQELSHLAPLRQSLYDEMLGRIQEDDTQVPYRDGDWWYYRRTRPGEAYSIHCRAAAADGEGEEVLLDENLLAEGLDYLDVVTAVSPSGGWLVYGVDDDGSEQYTLHFKNLTDGTVLEETIPDTGGDVEWSNDEQTVYYTTLDEAHRPDTVHRHTIGQAEDAVVFSESDERFYVWLSRTRSDAYVVISTESTITSEHHVIDADSPAAAPQVIQPRHQGMEYRISHHSDRFYITTNDSDDAEGVHDQGAVNFKLVSAPVSAPGRENWTEVIPHDPAVQLADVDVFADFVVLWERAEGLRRLRVMQLSDGAITPIAQPEPVYAIWGAPNRNFDATTYRFSYESLTTPDSTVEVDLTSQARTLLREKPVLGGYDRTRYTTERIEAVAEDGTKVPISLVYRTDLKAEGGNPTFLTGYGAYGASYDPYFSANRISLLDRGVVFAIAHVRGGGELGRPWYEAGKFLNKKNTFTDFIAVARHLRADGYTSRLAVEGGSAGGLLIGAVVNMAPDLFDAAVAEVPFVDVINTMRDPSIPLTVTEWEEWGNPEDPEYFAYMLSYSPYDNVTAQDYPPLLITGGLNDPRVQYWEPTKWIAKLRATETGEAPLLLKMNMGAGHSGSSGRYGYLEDIAYTWAFCLEHLQSMEHSVP